MMRKGLDNPPLTGYNTPMSKTNLTITVSNLPRRNSVIAETVGSGIRMRAKSWSKNGRFAGPKAERRANRAAIRRGEW